MRYGYEQRYSRVPRYLVFAKPSGSRGFNPNGSRGIGEVWRDPRLRMWHAELYTDPLIIGRGRTRDDAVDHAYQQVGGAG